jgi:hypothetical protein
VNSLGKGSATVSKWVLELAQQLLEDFPDALHLLVGVKLVNPLAKGSLCFDLILVTDRAIFVAIEANAKQRPVVTPGTAAQVLAEQLQHAWMVSQQIPVYAFWLRNGTASERDNDAPICQNAHEVQQFMLRATASGAPFPNDKVVALVEGLLRQDVDAQSRRISPLRQLGQALRHWIELPGSLEQKLQEQFHRPLLFGHAGPLLPADVNRHLAKAMLARDRMLEDADYKKIVPNDYIVELNQDNYTRHYQPIETAVRERWQAILLEVLETANRRLGRQVYKLGGPVRVQVRPGANLAASEVRILAQITPATNLTATLSTFACLELTAQGRRWPLRSGRMTIGRDPQCDINVELPAVQQMRLVSGRHAYIVTRNGKFRLFDGATNGEPSTNGTFVNGRRVGAEGKELQDGDILILGTLNPIAPQADMSGAVSLRFQLNCEPSKSTGTLLKPGVI